MVSNKKKKIKANRLISAFWFPIDVFTKNIICGLNIEYGWNQEPVGLTIFPAAIFFIFVSAIQPSENNYLIFQNKLADDWIRIVDLLFQKRPLC